MDRRRFVLGTGACLLPAGAVGALPIPAGNAIGFKVLRNGSPIGEHHLAFSQTGDSLAVTTNVALQVTMAGISVFHYTLQGVERWQGGVFQSFDSDVNYNGDALHVHAERTTGGYEVEGVNHDNPAKSMARYLAPPNLLPLTYWNKQMMYGTILNIQTAHSYPVHVTSPGWNSMPTANGGSVVAQRFDVTGKLTMSIWYDKDNGWASLAFQKAGAITYEKVIA